MARNPLGLWEAVLLALGLCLVLHTQAAPLDTKATRDEQQGDGQDEEHQPRVATLDEIFLKVIGGQENLEMLETLTLNTTGYTVDGMDLLLDPEQTAGHDSSRISKRRRPSFVVLWPNAIIPYEWGSLTGFPRRQAMMQRAFDEWENQTCVRFVPAEPHHTNLINFTSPFNLCYSLLGMDIRGRSQYIGLSPGCHWYRVYLHELGHALGLVHEHQLPQRDNYVRIVMANVQRGGERDFNKYTEIQIPNAEEVPYSYTSIMHYGKYAFSKVPFVNQTIVALNASYDDVMGTAVSLSASDIAAVNLMYCNVSDCWDYAIDCPTYARFGLCQLHDDILEICEKSCHNCAGADCQDDDPHCPAYAYVGFCNIYKYVTLHCKLSCANCNTTGT